MCRVPPLFSGPIPPPAQPGKLKGRLWWPGWSPPGPPPLAADPRLPSQAASPSRIPHRRHPQRTGLAPGAAPIYPARPLRAGLRPWPCRTLRWIRPCRSSQCRPPAPSAGRRSCRADWTAPSSSPSPAWGGDKRGGGGAEAGHAAAAAEPRGGAGWQKGPGLGPAPRSRRSWPALHLPCRLAACPAAQPRSCPRRRLRRLSAWPAGAPRAPRARAHAPLGAPSLDGQPCRSERAPSAGGRLRGGGGWGLLDTALGRQLFPAAASPRRP